MQHVPFCVWYFVKLGRLMYIFALIAGCWFSVKSGVYYMNIPQFSHSFIKHLSCLQFEAIKNSVGVNRTAFFDKYMHSNLLGA